MCIRDSTWEMHMTAEYGVAAHGKYKTGSGEGTKPGDEEKFAWIRRLLETCLLYTSRCV